MKLLVAFLLAVLWPIRAFAQSTPPADPWASIAFLEGTWDARTSADGSVAAAGTYTFRTELGGHILARHSTTAGGCHGPKTYDCEHGDLLYVYRDAADAALKAIYFDNEGHVIHYDVITPSPESAMFVSDPATPGPQFRLLYKRKAGVMTGKFQVKAPGQEAWKSYLEWSGSKHGA